MNDEQDTIPLPLCSESIDEATERRIADMMASAPLADDFGIFYLPGDLGPQPPESADSLEKTRAECAALDQSDTDNGKRLMRYFGTDVRVIAQAGSLGGTYLAWSGAHWDIANGVAGAMKLAQQVGPLINMEADYIEATATEAKMIDVAKDAKAELGDLEAKDSGKMEHAGKTEHKRAIKEAREKIAAGSDARTALNARKFARRRFAVSSKNSGRCKNMLEMAGPHMRRSPEDFNADPLRVATLTHTLQFEKIFDYCPGNPDKKKRIAKVTATIGHDRNDHITALIPVAYEINSQAPEWTAFLARLLIDEDKRRTVQQFCGMCLLGLPVQYVMYHYGHGANGKSVFLETIVRVLGESFAVSLPSETIMGLGDRSAGGAAPDIVRLFGKRMLRIAELPPGKPLQEDVVKRLVGGEKLTARDMFKGYFDFQPIAKPHFSGNGFPKIDGTDNGIWRRFLVVHWDQTIPENERRDFEEVVREFTAQGPGILNWMIEGALDALQNGLVIAPAIRIATQSYRDEMDTVGQFIASCTEEKPGELVQARKLYDAYRAWCHANAKTAVFETKFGRVMKMRIRFSDNGKVNQYCDIALKNIPETTSAGGSRPQSPQPADVRDQHDDDDAVPM